MYIWSIHNHQTIVPNRYCWLKEEKNHHPVQVLVKWFYDTRKVSHLSYYSFPTTIIQQILIKNKSKVSEQEYKRLYLTSRLTSRKDLQQICISSLNGNIDAGFHPSTFVYSHFPQRYSFFTVFLAQWLHVEFWGKVDQKNTYNFPLPIFVSF